MKRRQLMKVLMVSVAVACAVSAQVSIKFRGSIGWCIGDQYDQIFVNTSQETVVGEVESIDTITPMRNMSTGIQVMLRTQRNEEIAVHLGPSWFIINQDINLKINDNNIEVRGYRTMMNGKPIIMASTLVRKDKVLMLRDADGVPYWCAWRPRFR